jgi:hypothetical protein
MDFRAYYRATRTKSVFAARPSSTPQAIRQDLLPSSSATKKVESDP